MIRGGFYAFIFATILTACLPVQHKWQTEGVNELQTSQETLARVIIQLKTMCFSKPNDAVCLNNRDYALKLALTAASAFLRASKAIDSQIYAEYFSAYNEGLTALRQLNPYLLRMEKVKK